MYDYSYSRVFPPTQLKVLCEGKQKVPTGHCLSVAFGALQQTPLHLAARSPEVFQVLFDSLGDTEGVLVLQQDVDGRTPLHVATEVGSPKVIRMLHKWDAKSKDGAPRSEGTQHGVNCKIHDGRSALQMALRFRGVFPTNDDVEGSWMKVRVVCLADPSLFRHSC